jgi:quercetin dioxygenase-like cupin family protein
MTIQEIKEELKTAQHPVARAIDHNDHFKVLIIGFNKGMQLKKHTAKVATKLTVLEGTVRYIEGVKTQQLNQYHEYEIPVDVLHEVEAVTDSLCLLTQGLPPE